MKNKYNREQIKLINRFGWNFKSIHELMESMDLVHSYLSNEKITLFIEIELGIIRSIENLDTGKVFYKEGYIYEK